MRAVRFLVWATRESSGGPKLRVGDTTRAADVAGEGADALFSAVLRDLAARGMTAPRLFSK